MAPCVSQDCVNLLGLKPDMNRKYKVRGVTGGEQPVGLVNLTIGYRCYGYFELTLNALVVNNTVRYDGLRHHEPKDWMDVYYVGLADPEGYKNNNVDILIAPEYWDDILLDDRLKRPNIKIHEGPTFRDSRFGFIAMGAIKNKTHVTQKLTELNHFHMGYVCWS